MFDGPAVYDYVHVRNNIKKHADTQYPTAKSSNENCCSWLSILTNKSPSGLSPTLCRSHQSSGARWCSRCLALAPHLEAAENAAPAAESIVFASAAAAVDVAPPAAVVTVAAVLVARCALIDAPGPKGVPPSQRLPPLNLQLRSPPALRPFLSTPRPHRSSRRAYPSTSF